MKATSIGCIGLGIMGQSMVLNLLKAGFPVTVFNRTLRRMQTVVQAGARAAYSPRAVAEKSEIIITMVTGSPDVVAVIEGPEGVLQGLRPGSVVIDMSTISPSVTRHLAAEIEKKGGEMKLPSPALALVSQLFNGCQAHDEGREGTQALIKSLQRLGNTGNAWLPR